MHAITHACTCALLGRRMHTGMPLCPIRQVRTLVDSLGYPEANARLAVDAAPDKADVNACVAWMIEQASCHRYILYILSSIGCQV